MTRLLLFVTILTFFTFNSIRGLATILPPNDLHLYDDISFAPNMSEVEFNQIVDEIINVYLPLADQHGVELIAEKSWSDSTVNAYAYQDEDKWYISMFGGLARRAEVTPDGFAMVVCHELGHHFAGFPFYGNNDWAASEGQSDYYATQACARMIWGDQSAENAKYRSNVPAPVQQRCNAVWSSEEDQNLCYRVADAGMSLAALLAALGYDPRPKYDTPDTSRVKRTTMSHPAAQCRLDTYFNGGLCAASFDMSVIPGKRFKNRQNGRDAEKEASDNSCTDASGYSEGKRPACWFKARF